MAIKMCCYFKNSELLQKIIEQYSNLSDKDDLSQTFSEIEMEQFEVKDILNYDYLEGKRKLDIPNYRNIIESFQGVNPLHIAISRNAFSCVRLLLEETNLDPTHCTSPKNETPVILACKHAVSIEILESLLVSLRNLWPIE
jgi:ankyrin repeat protein